MNKLLRGVLKFNSAIRKNYLAEIDKVSQEIVKPMTVFITCMDCRLDPLRFLQTQAGEVFVVRNPGNMVPLFDPSKPDNASAEGGGLELGCIMNGIGDVVVCGHSNCKAVNSLYSQRHVCHEAQDQEHTVDSPLKTWLSAHGLRTVQKFTKLFSEEEQLLSVEGKKILGGFKLNFGKEEFLCAVDPQNDFSIEDKLSQFHCLQQTSNVASYPILQPYIASGDVRVHAMWFDIFRAQMFMFSRTRGHFVAIEESSVDELREEAKS
ncbi:carbonic anhydrase [Elysia marginata]|uniref:Carbonic anhydrase n=1 Tax=Elysia marginata TaxID=1093978 RepID=A0AAV4G6E6_9GAST|nr:carbonic anhydrase [Elysia marginata]